MRKALLILLTIIVIVGLAGPVEAGKKVRISTIALMSPNAPGARQLARIASAGNGQAFTALNYSAMSKSFGSILNAPRDLVSTDDIVNAMREFHNFFLCGTEYSQAVGILEQSVDVTWSALVFQGKNNGSLIMIPRDRRALQVVVEKSISTPAEALDHVRGVLQKTPGLSEYDIVDVSIPISSSTLRVGKHLAKAVGKLSTKRCYAVYDPYKYEAAEVRQAVLSQKEIVQLASSVMPATQRIAMALSKLTNKNDKTRLGKRVEDMFIRKAQLAFYRQTCQLGTLSKHATELSSLIGEVLVGKAHDSRFLELDIQMFIEGHVSAGKITSAIRRKLAGVVSDEDLSWFDNEFKRVAEFRSVLNRHGGGRGLPANTVSFERFVQ